MMRASGVRSAAPSASRPRVGGRTPLDSDRVRPGVWRVVCESGAAAGVEVERSGEECRIQRRRRHEPGCDGRKSAATHGSAKPEGEESRLRVVVAGRCRRRARRAPGGSASGLLSDSRHKPAPRTDGGRCSASYFDRVGNTVRYSGHSRSMLAPTPTMLHVRPSSAAASASSPRVPPTCERVQRTDQAAPWVDCGAGAHVNGPERTAHLHRRGGGAHKPPAAPRGARRWRA